MVAVAEGYEPFAEPFELRAGEAYFLVFLLERKNPDQQGSIRLNLERPFGANVDARLHSLDNPNRVYLFLEGLAETRLQDDQLVFPQVKEGDYRLEIAGRDLETVEMEIRVTAGEVAELSVPLTVSEGNVQARTSERDWLRRNRD